jgi:D-alanyl-D-alanine carboxypeptidase
MTDAAAIRRIVAAAADPLLAAAGAPGGAVALSIDGHRLDIGLGFADGQRTAPMPADATFSLYSITKACIAVAALKLAEAGALNLDAPLRAILPRPGYEGTPSIRQLVNHTGGIPDYGGLPAYHDAVRAAPDAPWSANEFLERTLPLGPLFPPGAGWEYSNVGFLLVRLALERATGQSLAALLDDVVVAPLGLRQTRLAVAPGDMRGLAPGFGDERDGGGAPLDVLRRYHPGWVSHGTAISTAAETLCVLDGLLDGRLLRPAPLAAMLDGVAVPGDHPPFVRPAYGLGVMLDLGSPFGRVVGHAGGGPGHATAAFRFPDIAGRRLGIVVLANRGASGVAQEIAFALSSSLAASGILG